MIRCCAAAVDDDDAADADADADADAKVLLECCRLLYCLMTNVTEVSDTSACILG